MKKIKLTKNKAPLTLSNGKTVVEPRSKAPIVIAVMLVATLISVQMTGFKFSTLITNGSKFFTIIINMFPIATDYMPSIWTPLFETIKMSVIGSFLGAVLAVPFAMIAASNIVKNKIIINASRIFLGITRTLPTLVVALIATYIFGLGSFAGTVAITVFTFAYIGKLLYEQIETVNMGAYEAMEAMGTTKLRSFINGVVPQVMPGYIANCLFCFEGNIRYAAILGYVGAGGLGMILNENIGWREYQNVGMILVTLFITVAVIEVVSHQIRKKLM
ncbi:MAG: phosphonate ABC transporter, permease protein PhnE [Clostridia bacterium]